MKVIIAGGRDFDDGKLLQDALGDVDSEWGITEIVSGCARGADRMGEYWALQNGIPVREFPADWRTHGRSAGYIRNRQMADYADGLVAFWDGKSRGTANMIEQAQRQGLQVEVISYDKHEPYDPELDIDGGC